MNSEEIRRNLIDLLSAFDTGEATDVREKVLGLIPAFDALRELGKSLLPEGMRISARDRILKYFLRYPRIVINEKEITIVAGISEWARRLRELRVQYGWPIINGITAAEMAAQGEFDIVGVDPAAMGPDDYILIDDSQDRDAAFRWNTANEIRREKISMRDKILKYLRKNVGEAVTGEELRYVAGGSEWARRVRELRTEDGWPIVTKTSGRPDLPVGAYVLEQDRQTPNHDRRIPDPVRVTVLRRDTYTCRICGWTHDLWNRSDPRFLELHHILPHAEGGESVEANLITYCNICHDQIHKKGEKG